MTVEMHCRFKSKLVSTEWSADKSSALYEARVIYFLFSVYGQTDTILESSHGNMLAHKKNQLKAQN